MELLSRFVRQLAISFPHISWHDTPCHRDHEEIRRFSEHDNFSLVLVEIMDSNMVL